MAVPGYDILRRLAVDVFDVFDVAAGRGTEPEPEPQVDAETLEQIRLRTAVTTMRRAYEVASEGRALDELMTIVARDLREGGDALLAWLDLHEEIVQLTERRFGSQRGQGQFKAQQAKAAVRRLLERADPRSAEIVALVGPAVVDLFTGWFIDVTVALLNNNKVLWQPASDTVRLPLRTRLLTRVFRFFAWLVDRLNPPPVLDPVLYDEVERIARGPGSPLVMIDRLLELGDWVSRHRRQTLALVQLVSAACDEVEFYASLRGSASKQIYARNLIIATLEDAGLELGDLETELAEAAIDLMIDFVVATNNKRGRYLHPPL